MCAVPSPESPRPPVPAYIPAAAVGVAGAFVLCGYEFVRSPSNTLFKAAYGADALPYVMAAVPLTVMAVLYVYGRLLTALGPQQTLLVTSVGSSLFLAAAYGAIGAGWAPATIILYQFREAYIVLLLEQYWSFLDSTLGTSSAKKLNGPICGVASVGAIAGGRLIQHLTSQVGAGSWILLAAVATLPAAGLMELAYRRCGQPQPRTHAHHSDSLGVRALGQNPLLLAIMAMVLLTQAMAALLDLNFQRMLQAQMPDPNQQTAFSGGFYADLNMAALILQFVAAPLLLRLLPLGLIHLSIPLVHVVSCAYLLGRPSLHSAGLALLLFKSVDYSVFKAAKEVLYIPLSFDARYRAKELIDVFGYRFGKGGASLALASLPVAALAPVPLAAGAVAAATAWAAVAALLARVVGRGMPKSAQVSLAS